MSGLSGLGGCVGKTAQTAQILLKKLLKNRSFLAVIFERFFKQDLSGFRAVFERLSRVEVPDSCPYFRDKTLACPDFPDHNMAFPDFCDHDGFCGLNLAVSLELKKSNLCRGGFRGGGAVGGSGGRTFSFRDLTPCQKQQNRNKVTVLSKMIN